MTSGDPGGRLAMGMRVRVARRHGATGVIDGFSVDKTVTPPRGVAWLVFDKGGHGLNWFADCEPVPFGQQPRAWQAGEMAARAARNLSVQAPCRYEPVEGDPAIRVCVTHDPDLGLYGDESCAGAPR